MDTVAPANLRRDVREIRDKNCFLVISHVTAPCHKMEALNTRNPPPTGYMYGNKTGETRPHGVYIKEKGKYEPSWEKRIIMMRWMLLSNFYSCTWSYFYWCIHGCRHFVKWWMVSLYRNNPMIYLLQINNGLKLGQFHWLMADLSFLTVHDHHVMTITAPSSSTHFEDSLMLHSDVWDCASLSWTESQNKGQHGISIPVFRKCVSQVSFSGIKMSFH